MRICPKNNAGGFSLVEVLLTLVLVLGLAAAAVFSFTAIYRTANLDEGMDRFQGLIRFAQAEAATSGRKIRLEFEPAAAELAADAPAGAELRRIRVTWEPDYLTAPGVFETLTNKGWSEEMVNELVGVATVKPLDASAVAAAAVPAADAEPVAPGLPAADYFAAEEFPAITFYPDGSCDSAEIVLASLNEEDQRRLAVRLSGILGTVTSRTMSSSDDLQESDDFSDQAAAEEFDAMFDSAEPVAPFGE